MITSVTCRAVHLSIAGCPGARHGVPVDLPHHNGRVRVHRRSGQRRSNKSENKEQPRSGCQADWADTKLCLNNRARPDVRRTAVAIVAGRLPLCACRARQLITYDAARSRQTVVAIETGRLANCHELQWRLPPGGNRMSLEGVTVIRLIH